MSLCGAWRLHTKMKQTDIDFDIHEMPARAGLITSNINKYAPFSCIFFKEKMESTNRTNPSIIRRPAIYLKERESSRGEIRQK